MFFFMACVIYYEEYCVLLFMAFIFVSPCNSAFDSVNEFERFSLPDNCFSTLCYCMKLILSIPYRKDLIYISNTLFFSIFYECFVIYCFISDVLLFCRDSQRYQSIKVVFCAVMRVLEMLLLFIFTHCCQEHTCHVSYHFNLLIVFAHRCFCNCLSLQCQFLVIPILPIYPFT